MNMNTLDVTFHPDAIAIAYPPLESALTNWSDATTDPTSDRRNDLKHDKQKAVADFFKWIGKAVHEITPNYVKSWQIELEKRNLAPAYNICDDKPNFIILRVVAAVRGIPGMDFI